MNHNNQNLDAKETCYSTLNSLDDTLSCENKNCEFNCKSHTKSCSLVALLNEETGRLTLQDVGDMFSVSRMRICQIEKMIIRSLRAEITPDDFHV